MWRCVYPGLTDVSEECIASIIRIGNSAADCSHMLTLVPRSRIFIPWRWRQYVPPKHRLTQDLHDATSQKTTFFIVTAVKTSNLTYSLLFIVPVTTLFITSLSYFSFLVLWILCQVKISLLRPSILIEVTLRFLQSQANPREYFRLTTIASCYSLFNLLSHV
jgi:hypothetical protein